jgi:phosphoserine phosphatase RsbU/P
VIAGDVETTAAPAPQPGGAVRHVLVVDDSRLQRRILSASLARWGYCVHEAGNGAEALAICRRSPVDLVLSDWIMPGMSGLELCRAFRALPRESYGYFILLTSSREKGAVARGLEEGADDFLAKPVSPGELRARITAGDRILTMTRELNKKNRLVTETLSKLQQVYDSLERDLGQARELQQSLLRRRLHDFGPARVSLMLRPSGHVGGDLVGCFPINSRRFGMFTLDVSGHGVTSALLSARLAGLFSGSVPEQNIAVMPGSEHGYEGRPPAEVAAQMNRLLLEEVDTEHYCTLIYGDVDLLSGNVRLVQAGHPHPARQQACGRVEFIGAGGLPVGLIDDAGYEEFDLTLKPGDRLLMVSDGVTECPDPVGRELGEQGLAKIMRRHARSRGEAFHKALLWELGEHSAGSEFRDDVSSVLVEFDGAEGARPRQ